MENEPVHVLTTRHITETKWFCTNKTRCKELDEMIATANEHLGQLNTLVAEKWFGDQSGMECKRREIRLNTMLVDLRKERAALWRRGKKEVEETIDETTGQIVATSRKVVPPRKVEEGPFIAEASLDGKALVQIRHV